MELSQRVDELEAELKVVKNEIQTVLLDIRERILSYYDNPFQVIDAKSGGGGRDDIDASFAAGGPVSGSSESDKPASGREGTDASAESGQLKAILEQMERERKALEQEKEALNQEKRAAEAASAQQAPSGQPAPAPDQTIPGYGPGQPVPPTPMQPAMQAPVGQIPIMQQPPMQPFPGQGPAQPPPQAGYPAQHQHTHHRFGDQPRSDQGFDERREYAQYARQGDAGAPPEGWGSAPPPDSAPAEKGPAGRRDAGKFGRRPAGSWTAKGSEKGRPADRDKQDQEKPPSSEQSSEVNLMTLVGLVRWVEKSIKKIGKERVEAIVEIYRTAGYLPSIYHETITQVIRLADEEKPDGPVGMGDSINVLLQLDNLLGNKFKAESAVLATLFGEEGGYPWTKP